MRVSVTRHLGYVRALTVLSSPTVPAPPTGSAVPTSAVSWTAPDHAVVTLDPAAVRECTGLALPEVDPASLSGLGRHIPPGAAVRAFSDGANQVLIGTMPPGQVPPAATAPDATPGVPEAGGRERWIAGQLLVRLGPAGLVAVEVDLRDRTSAQRQQIAVGVGVAGGDGPDRDRVRRADTTRAADGLILDPRRVARAGTVPGVPGRPRPNGRIVVLGAFPSRVEADVVAQALDDDGIQAIVEPSDAQGWLPNLAAYHGVRVLVFDEDLDRAKALLATVDPQGTAPD